MPHAVKFEEQCPNDTLQIPLMTLEITIYFQFFLYVMLWIFSWWSSLCSLKPSMLRLLKPLHCHFQILVDLKLSKI